MQAESQLFDVIDATPATPATRVWKTPGRPSEPDLAGLRDRALLLVGFVAALRRSELAALTVDDIAEHPNGLIVSIPRSKTKQVGDHAELVVLPRGSSQPHRSPTAALQAWLDARIPASIEGQPSDHQATTPHHHRLFPTPDALKATLEYLYS